MTWLTSTLLVATGCTTDPIEGVKRDVDALAGDAGRDADALFVGCPSGGFEVSVTVGALPASPGAAGPRLFIDGDHAYWSDPFVFEDGRVVNPEDPEVWRVALTDLTAPPEPLTDNDARDTLAGVSDDATLILRSTDASPRSDLVLRAADGEEETLAAPLWLEEVNLLKRPYYPRLLGNGVAAWLECVRETGNACAPERVVVWDGQSRATVTEHGPTLGQRMTPPRVEGRRVVWAVRDLDGEHPVWTLWRWADGEAEVLVDEASELYPPHHLHSGGWVWWATPDGVFRTPFDGGPVTSVASGTCDLFDASAGRVAFACLTEASTPTIAATIDHARLYVDDGVATVEIPSPGVLVGLPRLSSGALAWLASDDAAATASEGGPGVVRIAPLEDPSARQDVAPVTLPCTGACQLDGAPLPVMHLDDERLTWTRAVDPETGDSDPERLGVARLTPRARCD